MKKLFSFYLGIFFALFSSYSNQAFAQEPNYYQVLGVSENASADEIKLAARRLLMRNHPDLNGGAASSSEMTKKILSAKEVLLDSTQRAQYDQKISKSKKFEFQDFGTADQKSTTKQNAGTNPKSTEAEKPTASGQARTKAKSAASETSSSSPANSAKTEPQAAPEAQGTGAKSPSDADILRNKKNLKAYDANRCGKGFLGAVFDELL